MGLIQPSEEAEIGLLPSSASSIVTPTFSSPGPRGLVDTLVASALGVSTLASGTGAHVGDQTGPGHRDLGFSRLLSPY